MTYNSIKIIIDDKEYTAILSEDIKDLHKRAYEKGYADGFQHAFEKTFWNERK